MPSGRWSALTLDKVFQAGALWERDLEASKSAEILAEVAKEEAPRLSPKELATVIEGLAAAGLYSLALLRSAEKLLEPHLASLDREVKLPAFRGRLARVFSLGPSLHRGRYFVNEFLPLPHRHPSRPHLAPVAATFSWAL